MKKLLVFALGLGILLSFSSCSLRSGEDEMFKAETDSYESADALDPSAIDEYINETRCGIVEIYGTEQDKDNDNALLAVDLTVNDSDTIDVCLTDYEMKYDYLYVKMSGNVTDHTLGADGRINIEDNAKFSVTYNDKRTIDFVIKLPKK